MVADDGFDLFGGECVVVFAAFVQFLLHECEGVDEDGGEVSSDFVLVWIGGGELPELSPRTLNLEMTCLMPRLRMLMVEPIHPYSWKNTLSSVPWLRWRLSAVLLYWRMSLRRSALNSRRRMARAMTSKSTLSMTTLWGELISLGVMKVSRTFWVPSSCLWNLTMNWFSL
jgi:hypothetical protein